MPADYRLNTITELAENIRDNLPDPQKLIERNTALGHSIMAFSQENLAQSGLDCSSEELRVAAACGAVAAIQLIILTPGALDELIAIKSERDQDS